MVIEKKLYICKYLFTFSIFFQLFLDFVNELRATFNTATMQLTLTNMCCESRRDKKLRENKKRVREASPSTILTNHSPDTPSSNQLQNSSYMDQLQNHYSGTSQPTRTISNGFSLFNDNDDDEETTFME